MTWHDLPPCVVVGIDGSRTAVQAALWAVDEAVSRGIPLRLVCAIDPADAKPNEDEAHRLATAEIIVRQAYTAIEAADQNIKIEIEIIQGSPTEVLRQASRSAVVICVGALGLRHFHDGHFGSTAESLARSAGCPVAVIRGDNSPTPGATDLIIAEVDESADADTVLQLGMQEARLRHAPLRVLASWHSSTTHHGERPFSDDNAVVAARLERRLDRCRHQHPDVDVTGEVVHGGCLDYLKKHSEHIQLVITSAANGHTVLHDCGSSILITNQRRL